MSDLKLLIAPDKFKHSLSASEAASAIAQGAKRANANIQIDLCPLADGGEGTVEALVTATNGRYQTARVTGPLPEMKVEARFGILGDNTTAVIEMSAASGLHLLGPRDRDPMRTTTFGTGELLMAAAKLGVTHIILGIGGSATNDVGIGCAQACELPVLMQDGEPTSLTEPLTGADLPRVAYVKHGRGSPIERVKITVATDVTNPLYGPHGAAQVFGPQKGATPHQIQILEKAAEQLALRGNNNDIALQAGAGAAGGLGFAMAAFFNATLRPGIDIVMEAVNLPHRLANTNLCITGEGRLDHQSLGGKTAIGVARACKAAGVPCIALVGSVDESARQAYAEGLTAFFSICDGPMDLKEAIRNAEKLLKSASENAIRLYLTRRR